MNFADPGLWVWQVANFDYNKLRRAQQAGFRWIAIQVCSGTDPVITGDYKDLIASARSLGIDVAGFGWCIDQPEAEAEMAAQMLASWGLFGFIANGEKSLGYTQESGPCPDCFGYSQRWVDRWRSLSTGLPLAFSSYANFAQHDIHYRPWIEAGAKAMPQVYWNEFEWATPHLGVSGALDVKQPWNGPPMGWPSHEIHVTFANYKSGNREIPSPEQYAASLLRTSARGFNVYLGELMTEEQFVAYEKLIPTLTSISRPGLTPEQLPYTGPYYGPSHTKGPMKGPTAKALKRALYRLGIEPSFTKTDERYNAKLEAAMARWQRGLSLAATGQYGRGSYDAMRAAIAPDGSYAMDKTAREWVEKEAGGAV